MTTVLLLEHGDRRTALLEVAKGAEKTVGFISESLDFLKAERSDLDNSSDRPKGILLLETPESVRILASFQVKFRVHANEV